MMTKKCTKCKLEKPLDQFGPHKNAAHGLQPQCRSCKNAAQRERRKENQAAKDYMKNWNLIQKYGITLEEYQEMLVAQNGLCAICHQPPRGNNDKEFQLAVDHDHITGNVRGLLCTLCNRGLGFFGDQVELLENAAKYLKTATKR